MNREKKVEVFIVDAYTLQRDFRQIGPKGSWMHICVVSKTLKKMIKTEKKALLFYKNICVSDKDKHKCGFGIGFQTDSTNNYTTIKIQIIGSLVIYNYFNFHLLKRSS